MPSLALLAAVAAAVTWAAASLIAHGAAKQLGAVEFTRVQLTTSSLVLAAMVAAGHGWDAIPNGHMPALVVSSIIGVLLTNLAMSECLRRAGPRRTQLLLTMRTPITGLLAFIYLGEVLTPALVLGTGLILGGILLAIIFGRGNLADHPLEAVDGSLATVVLLGLMAATCQAIGFVAIKPAMLEGMQPLAASALRTMGSAWALTTMTLIPTQRFAPPCGTNKEKCALGDCAWLVGLCRRIYAAALCNTEWIGGRCSRDRFDCSCSVIAHDLACDKEAPIAGSLAWSCACCWRSHRHPRLTDRLGFVRRTRVLWL